MPVLRRDLAVVADPVVGEYRVHAFADGGANGSGLRVEIDVAGGAADGVVVVVTLALAFDGADLQRHAGAD